jgi:hypothetical protein|tara:strand:+ start:807 stop:971 length:165 start_codon:yes stop_codon:yes gene_type:complete
MSYVDDLLTTGFDEELYKEVESDSAAMEHAINDMNEEFDDGENIIETELFKLYG